MNLHISSYWSTSIICFVIWWVIASGLVFLSWNHVVASITNLKKIKFWHALLILATISAFCAPRYYHKSKKYRGHHGYHHKGKYECSHKGKEECPFKGTGKCPHEQDGGSDQGE